MNEFFLNFGVWGWLSFGVILMILELFVPGAFMIWFGFGALLTGIFVALFNPLTAGMQILIFTLMSVFSVAFGIFVYAKIFGKNKESAGSLKTGAKRFIGQTFVVSETIKNGKGKVNVADTVWLAKSDKKIEKGSQVVVKDVTGTVLIVDEV